MSATNNLHVEGASSEHTREGAFALADGEGLAAIVPCETDGAVQSLFVVVVVAFVFVEGEGGIGARINNEVDVIEFVFVGVLYVRTQWKDGTCLDVEWRVAQWGVGCDGLAAIQTGVSPLVIPLCSCWQIDVEGLGG